MNKLLIIKNRRNIWLGIKKIYNGIQFDSLFEFKCYKTLLDSGIKISDIHKSFELVESFQYSDLNNKKHKSRNIIYTPDFIIESEKYSKPIAIEIKKGIITNDYLMRRKLFLYKYSNDYYFIQINSDKELKEFTNEITN